MSTVYLSRVGITAPGLTEWSGAMQVLCGTQPYVAETLKLTAPELLPATERRRSSDSVRIALRAAEQALSAEAAAQIQPAAVFSSAYGDTTVTHKLCELLSETPPAASPTLFHNSVHNAAAGYWSIATANQQATNSIAAGDYSATAGLIAAASHCIAEQQAVLLITYDLTYPHPLDERCRVTAPFASALLLHPEANPDCGVRLDMRIAAGTASRLQDPELEALRCGNPAARMLPLLQAIAANGGNCRLPYNEQQQLQLEVTKCS